MESERLILRPFALTDAEALYAIAKDIDVGIHAGWAPHTSVENSRDILEHVLIGDDQYVIIEKESGALIGAVGLVKDPKRENDDARMLGYWIAKAYWGHGYAVEASKLVLAAGFQRYDIISSYHYASNLRSKRVIEKLGFVYEGYQHKAIKRFDGEILDNVLYSMSKEMFDQHN